MKKKNKTVKNANDFFKGRQQVISLFESSIFQAYSRASPRASNNDFDITLISEPLSTSSP